MGGEKEIINGIYSDIQKLAYRDVHEYKEHLQYLRVMLYTSIEPMASGLGHTCYLPQYK